MNTRVLNQVPPELSSPRFSYCAFGRLIDSPLPLILPRPPLFSGGETPLTIAYTDAAIEGPLPHNLGAIRYGRHDQTMGVVVPGVGEFLLENRNQLWVRRAPGAPDARVAAALSALVLVFALRQDPTLVFHGSAVGWRGGSCLFLGSPLSTSTLAVALGRHGGAWLSQDLSAVAPGPVVWPGLRSGLPPGVLEHLWSGDDGGGLGDEGWTQADGRPSAYPLPLRSIFILGEQKGDRVAVDAVQGRARWEALEAHLQRLPGLDDPGQQRLWLERWLNGPSVWLVQRPERDPDSTRTLEEVLFLAGRQC